MAINGSLIENRIPQRVPSNSNLQNHLFFSLPSSKLLEMSRNSCGQAIESKLEESGVPSGTAVRMT